MPKLLFLIIAFYPVFVFSQANYLKIEGKVINKDYEPIPNATIKIVKNDTTGLVNKFAFSDAKGDFSIKLPTIKDPMYLQISIVGYSTLNLRISDSIINNKISYILYLLSKDLPEVHVKAENQITQKNDTTSFKVSSFAKGNENSIADLLKRLPGLTVEESGALKFNGKNIDAVLLEDDDLFGSNYGNLVNNSSISGIEKIEIIENYKSKDKLENSLTKGKQTVVNLKYKGAGIRNFGQTNLGLAPNQKLHDLRLNLTTLSKTVKAASIANKNSTGFLAQQLFGLANEYDLPENRNIDYPQPNIFQKIPITINNIEPKNINKYRIFDNNSSLATTNLFFKLNKKIIFKNNYAFVLDNFLQNYNSTSNYINGTIPVSILQENKIEKNNHIFFTEGETSINWGEKNQTRINYFFTGGKGIQTSEGFFQNNILNQKLQNRMRQGSLLLTHVILLKEKSFINIKYNYYSSYSNANYNFTNPLQDSTFNIKSTDKKIIQLLSFDQNKHSISADWFKSLRLFNLSVNFNSAYKKINPISNAQLTKQNDTQENLNAGFQINQKTKISETELAFVVNKNFSSKLQMSITNKLKYLFYKIDTQATINQGNKLFYLPSFNITFKPTNKSQIILNGSLQSQAPNVEQLCTASIFTSNNNINTGSSEINFSTGYSFNVFYLISDLIHKRYSFYVSIIHSNMPMLYTNNFNSRELYIFNNLIPFYKNNNNFNANIGLDKNLVKLKSWVTIKANYNIGEFFSSNNILPITNTTTNLKLEFKYRTNWKKWINFNTAIVYTSSNFKASVSNYLLNEFKSSDWIANTTLELKINQKIFIDIQHDYLVNRSYKKPLQSIHFLDMKFKYNIDNNLSTSLVLRNILNTNAFTTNNASLTKNVVQNFSLSPFLGLISIGYKF